MSWFLSHLFGNKKRRAPAAGALCDGPHHAPGLGLLSELMEPSQPLDAILDLGPTSTQSLAFLSRRAHHVEVCDLFHGASPRGTHSELFQFDFERLDFPMDRRYDVVLVWDLLHYVRPAERPRFGSKVRHLLHGGGLVLVSASNVARIPPTPIHYKILGRERVEYVLENEPDLPCPNLHTRQVETAFEGLEPLRHFQLRNGFQELVFRRPVSVDDPDEIPDDRVASRLRDALGY